MRTAGVAARRRERDFAPPRPRDHFFVALAAGALADVETLGAAEADADGAAEADADALGAGSGGSSAPPPVSAAICPWRA
jgi:outer membrane receptor for monomeric catechols